MLNYKTESLMKKDLGKENSISVAIATVNGIGHTNALFSDGK
jgi:hypothetical protein